MMRRDENTEKTARLYATAIQQIYDVKNNADKLDSLRKHIVADQELQDIVDTYIEVDLDEEDIDHVCFGESYGPTPRTLTNDVGETIPDPNYDAENDICGRHCQFGLWKPPDQDGEVQGNQGCLLLLLFTDIFRVPLAPASLADAVSARFKLLKAIPNVLNRALDARNSEKLKMAYALNAAEGEFIEQGYVWNPTREEYTRDEHGNLIPASEVIVTAPTPTPPAPPTPPTPPRSDRAHW